uniref:Uncharacterized protein n=1 Tax=Oryza barthii TaxID=65489 RepID=A0A0D3EWU6_9ORYZ
MGRQSKRACAPTPMEVPSPGNQPVAPPGNQPVTQPLPPQFVVPSSFASTYRPGEWILTHLDCAVAGCRGCYLQRDMNLKY